MSEHDTQAAFVQWCAIHERKYPMLKLAFAIPNAAKRGYAVAAMMKAEGLRSGVPDWHLPYPAGDYNGLWIEFKFGKNKLSDNQREYIALLEKNGHCVQVCYSVDEAIDAVEGYLG